MEPSDRELIKAAIEGDPDNFEMLIPLFSRRLFAVAFAILQDREEAEDVVQETFLRAFKSRWRLRDPDKFPAFITAIARNRARDLYRKKRPVPLQDDAPEIADESAPRPDGQASDVSQCVLSALSALPEQHRLAVTLRYLDGMDYDSIERTMSLSNGALRGILGRALGKMRRALKPALAAMER